MSYLTAMCCRNLRVVSGIEPIEYLVDASGRLIQNTPLQQCDNQDSIVPDSHELEDNMFSEYQFVSEHCSQEIVPFLKEGQP